MNKIITMEDFISLGGTPSKATSTGISIEDVFVFSGGEGEAVLEASAFVGENGALSSDWMTNSFPEGDPMRTNPTLANIKTVQGLASQVVSGESQIGKLSGGHDFTFIPNENSTPEDIKAHHIKLGMPEDAAGYKLSEVKIPEGQERDTDYETKIAEVFHRIGISGKQASELAAAEVAIMSDRAAATKVKNDLEDRAEDLKIHEKFGAGYDREMADAVNFAYALGDKIDPEETKLLVEGMKHDSFTAQMFAAAAKLMKEKPQRELPGASDGTMTPNDIDIEIARLQSDPYYMSVQPEGKPPNKALHESIVAKITALTEMKFKG